jgi:hypothetical protein
MSDILEREMSERCKKLDKKLDINRIAQITEGGV